MHSCSSSAAAVQMQSVSAYASATHMQLKVYVLIQASKPSPEEVTTADLPHGSGQTELVKRNIIRSNLTAGDLCMHNA